MILRGDARRLPLPDSCVHCCITSPPYLGLRDYRCVNQIGLEPTVGAYIAAIVAAMREVKRVLRDEGTAWINCGDSYATNPGNGRGGEGANLDKSGGTPHRSGADKTGLGLGPKQRLGVPHRVALALQADGWIWRDEIVWMKPAPMPESVTDRCTKAHEFIFMFAKRPAYYYDAEAVAEPATHAGKVVSLGPRSLGAGQAAGSGIAPSGNGKASSVVIAAGRNKRSVWRVNPAPFPGAHFAVMPAKLVEPCILAGTSARGACPRCGAPWGRRTARDPGDCEAHRRPKITGGMHSTTSTLSLSGNGSREWAERGSKSVTLGWDASCPCDAGAPVPCLVLDPFAGSGTVVQVAQALGRGGVGVDLSAAYCRLARRRLDRPHAPHDRPPREESLPLFDGPRPD